MATADTILRIESGIVRQINLAASGSILHVDILHVGNGSPTALTKTILDGLISNSHASGSDNQNVIAGTGLTGGGSGATVNLSLDINGLTEETVIAGGDFVAIYDLSSSTIKKITKTNFVAGLLTADEKVKGSSNDTTAGYLEDKISVSHGSNTSTILEKTTLNDGGNEVVQIQLDQSKIDHGSIAGLGDDDHTQYHNNTRGDARYYQKSEFKNSSAGAGDADKPVKLDVSGKISNSMLPAIAITDTFVVASQAAMLALAVQTGDVAVRTDLNKSFILAGSDPSVLGDWQELLTPTDAVLSVNGATGAVTVNAINELTGDVTASAASGSQSKATTIAAGAVTEAKIGTAAVTETKIGPSAVTEAKIADNAVTTNKIAALAVTDEKLAANSVTTAKILDANVTTAKIADDAVTKDKINSNVAGNGLAQATDGSLEARGAFLPLTNGNGGTLNAGTVVYLTGTASTFDASDADAESTTKGTIGVLKANTATAAEGLVQVSGRATVLVEADAALTPGSPVFVSTVAGRVTHTAPSGTADVIFRLGVAVSTTEIVIQPQFVALID